METSPVGGGAGGAGCILGTSLLWEGELEEGDQLMTMAWPDGRRMGRSNKVIQTQGKKTPQKRRAKM